MVLEDYHSWDGIRGVQTEHVCNNCIDEHIYTKYNCKQINIGETDVCNENEIKSIANALISNGMYDLGYRYISLDDCWSACNRTQNGTLYAEPTRFPNGMASTIAYIHNLKSGLKFGLYTDVGTHTCSGGHRNGCHPPGSYGNFVTDANTLASWKVDLVKADDCSKPSNETWQNVHTEFSIALNSTGRPILFELDGGGDILLNADDTEQ